MGNSDRKFYNSRKQLVRNLIYAVLAIGIIMISAFYALKGEKSYVTEPYGPTTDGNITVNNQQEIRAVFTASEDHFQGIKLKLVTEVKAFNHDKLDFYLKDCETDSIISTYTLELKTVFPQQSFFIPLPMDNSKEKELSISIIGRDISAVPKLCTSKQTLSESKLFIDNLQKNDTYLVFAAVYPSEKSIRFEAVIKGLLYLALLLLLYLWPIKVQRAEDTALLKTEESKKGIWSKFLRKHYKFLIFVTGTLAYGSLIVFVYKNNIEERLEQKKIVDVIGSPDVSDEDPERYLTVSAETASLKQIFRASQDGLSGITFDVQVLRSEKTAKLHVQVLDLYDNISFIDQYVSVSDLPSKRGKWYLFLDKEYEKSSDQIIHINIEAVDFQDTEIAFYTGEPETLPLVMLGGVKTSMIPILSATYKDYRFLKLLFAIFSVLVFGFFLISFFLICVTRWPVEKLIIPFTLYLGTLYMLIIPVYSVPDEYAHIDCAYSISNRILGIEAPPDMPGYDYKRSADIETEEYLTYNTTIEDYRRLYLSCCRANRISDEDLELCASRASLANSNLLFYLPPALGITIARLLHLGTLHMFLMGRWMNLLAYVLMIYIAIRKLPCLKEVFFLYVSFPIYLQQAASFSYDCILNGFAMIFVSCCLALTNRDKTLDKTDGFLLLFTIIQLSVVKGGVYLPLCLIVLAVIIERRWSWKKNFGYILAVGACVGVSFLQGNIVRYLNTYFSRDSIRVNSFWGKEMYTFSYLLHHPLKLVSLYVNTFFVQGSRLLYEFFGGKMGSLQNIQLPWFYAVLFLILLLFVMIKDPMKIALSKISIVCMCFILPLCSCILIGLSMLLADTPKNLNYIYGIQGRYYYPVMFLPIVGICFYLSAQIHTTSSCVKEKLLFSAGHVLFLFSIIMTLYPS